MEVKEIEVEDLFREKDYILVDVRSPSEFSEFHIPGAINLPLFEDEEKRWIGFIYRSQGEKEAIEEGRKIGESKLHLLYRTFKELSSGNRPVVVYCWRGGMRSKEVCSVMSHMGLSLCRLRGGYRAYRNYILSRMRKILRKVRCVVITGRTGTGKTRLIEMLKGDSYPALNLEKLAKHRGSLFGRVGIKEKVSQKMFDSLLFEELNKLAQPFLILEDESRRIGNIHLPLELWEAKQRGTFVEIVLPLEERVRIILEDYTSTQNWQEEARKALSRLKRYLGPQKSGEAFRLFEQGRYEELVEYLITHHYDRRYRVFKKPDYRLTCDDLDQCYHQFKELYIEITRESTLQNQAL